MVSWACGLAEMVWSHKTAVAPGAMAEGRRGQCRLSANGLFARVCYCKIRSVLNA